jgi:hypothetical protein
MNVSFFMYFPKLIFVQNFEIQENLKYSKHSKIIILKTTFLYQQKN